MIDPRSKKPYRRGLGDVEERGASEVEEGDDEYRSVAHEPGEDEEDDHDAEVLHDGLLAAVVALGGVVHAAYYNGTFMRCFYWLLLLLVLLTVILCSMSSEDFSTLYFMQRRPLDSFMKFLKQKGKKIDDDNFFQYGRLRYQTNQKSLQGRAIKDPKGSESTLGGNRGQ
uniref:Uncharacterized protein n=1 Tax=Steinernema glaseri TaxID=37863 RepID=A0A1I8AFF6_9BILA